MARGLLLARVRRLLGVAPERQPQAARATWWLAGAIALAVAFALTTGGVPPRARAQEISKTQPPSVEWLHGRVVDENGKPVPGALVYDEASNHNMDPGLQEPTLAGADGSFQVPKLHGGGHWRIIAARLGDDALGWLDIGTGLAPSAAGADNVITRPIVLRARRYRLSGVCVDEQGRPLAGARIAVTNLPIEGGGGFTLTPNRSEKTITQFWEALTARSDARGAFSLTLPVDGGMSVEVSAPGRQTVYPFGMVRAGASETGDLGRITLTNAGVIAGQVVFAPWTTTDEQGRFRFDLVRPTEYEVTTTGVPHFSDGRVPPQEKRRVTVAAGGHVQMDALHFIPTGWTAPPSPSPDGTPVFTPWPSPTPATNPEPVPSPSPGALPVTHAGATAGPETPAASTPPPPSAAWGLR